MEFCDFPLKSSQHCRNVVLTSDIFGCANALSVKQNNSHLVFKFSFEWLWTWHKKTYKAVYTIYTLISFRLCVLSMQTKVKTFISEILSLSDCEHSTHKNIFNSKIIGCVVVNEVHKTDIEQSNFWLCVFQCNTKWRYLFKKI